MAVTLDQGRSSRRGPRFRPRAEINVTPFVDVMLVLLIVFMVTAPLLTVGVEVELPETDPTAMPGQGDALAVTIDQNGVIYIQETEIAAVRSAEVDVDESDEVAYDELVARLSAITQARRAAGEDVAEDIIYVRADGRADYQAVAQVLVRLRGAGFHNFGLVTNAIVTQ